MGKEGRKEMGGGPGRRGVIREPKGSGSWEWGCEGAGSGLELERGIQGPGKGGRWTRLEGGSRHGKGDAGSGRGDVGAAHPKSPRRKECEPLTRFSASAMSCTASRSLPALSIAPAFPALLPPPPPPPPRHRERGGRVRGAGRAQDAGCGIRRDRR